MSALPAIAGGRRGRAIAAVAALSLGQAGAAGAAAFATRDVFAALATPGSAGAGQDVAVATIALSGAAIAACRVGERLVAERVGQDYAAALRLEIFGHLSRLPARRLAERRAGGLALRCAGDLAAIRGWVSLGVARLLSAGIVLPAALAAVALIEPALGLAAAVPMAAGLGAMALVGWRFRAAHGRLRRERARLAGSMTERVLEAPALRLMGRAGLEAKALARRSARMIAAAGARARGGALMRAVPDAVSGTAAAAILALALGGAAGGAETAGALAALALSIQPLRDLAAVWDRRQTYLAARDRCRALLAEPAPPAGQRSAPRLARGRPARLAFRGVRAGPFRGLEASAGRGERIAVLGPNGSGKSTLLALAAGLESPDRGRVLVDGRPVQTLDDRARARGLCHVGARSPILAGSLRRALTMGAAGRRRLDDAAIADMARRFGLDPAIARLGGLSGRVASGGANLSAGEARRLVLARAALSGAGLLLLDEPDDALDAEAPALVATLLESTGATVLIATHDPRIAALAGRCWRIGRDGRLCDDGGDDPRGEAA
ncbi:MAG: ATP-binding cassette domain-containing protein [Pseudomonadota bacterium]